MNDRKRATPPTNDETDASAVVAGANGSMRAGGAVTADAEFDEQIEAGMRALTAELSAGGGGTTQGGAADESAAAETRDGIEDSSFAAPPIVSAEEVRRVIGEEAMDVGVEALRAVETASAAVEALAEEGDAEAVDQMLSDVGAELIEAGAQIDSARDAAAEALGARQPASVAVARSADVREDSSVVSAGGVEGTPIERLDTRLAEKAEQIVAEAESTPAASVEGLGEKQDEPGVESVSESAEVFDDSAFSTPEAAAAKPASPSLATKRVNGSGERVKPVTPSVPGSATVVVAAQKSAGGSGVRSAAVVSALGKVGSVAARPVLAVTVRPIERVMGRCSARTRQTIGFVAVATLFHALVAWVFILMGVGQGALPQTQEPVMLLRPGDPVPVVHTPKPVARPASKDSGKKDDHGHGGGGGSKKGDAKAKGGKGSADKGKGGKAAAKKDDHGGGHH